MKTIITTECKSKAEAVYVAKTIEQLQWTFRVFGGKRKTWTKKEIEEISKSNRSVLSYNYINTKGIQCANQKSKNRQRR